jgi:DNA invertase Pin-like site-specific DNA recombinase
VAANGLYLHTGPISQFENEIRTERQMEGIIKAKEKGVGFGRKKQLKQTDIDNLQQKRQSGILIKELMREYKLSKATIYRYLQNTDQHL